MTVKVSCLIRKTRCVFPNGFAPFRPEMPARKQHTRQKNSANKRNDRHYQKNDLPAQPILFSRSGDVEHRISAKFRIIRQQNQKDKRHEKRQRSRISNSYVRLENYHRIAEFFGARRQWLNSECFYKNQQNSQNYYTRLGYPADVFRSRNSPYFTKLTHRSHLAFAL